jgi:hypothetical protein
MIVAEIILASRAILPGQRRFEQGQLPSGLRDLLV